MNAIQEFPVVTGSIKDYEPFRKFHFVHRQPACPCKVFVIPPDIGCVVYAFPALASRARRLATGGIFAIGSRTAIAANVNKNIRTLARIVIHPGYRGHGIASFLVRKTLPLVGVPFVECSTNLFGASKCFCNAGMSRYMAKPSEMWFRVKAVYKELGFEAIQNLNFHHQKLFFEHLTKSQEKSFRTTAILYLNNIHCYHPDDTNYELHRKLIERFDEVPMYFYWFNPELKPEF